MGLCIHTPQHGEYRLTHWGRDKMAAVSQTTLSNAFSWMKMLEFRLRFHWRLFLRVQLTIFQHWFRQWLGAGQATSHYLNQWWLVYWRIYASLGLNELIPGTTGQIQWLPNLARCVPVQMCPMPDVSQSRCVPYQMCPRPNNSSDIWDTHRATQQPILHSEYSFFPTTIRILSVCIPSIWLAPSLPILHLCLSRQPIVLYQQTLRTPRVPLTGSSWRPLYDQ